MTRQIATGIHLIALLVPVTPSQPGYATDTSGALSHIVIVIIISSLSPISPSCLAPRIITLISGANLAHAGDSIPAMLNTHSSSGPSIYTFSHAYNAYPPSIPIIPRSLLLDW
jgi:hypothetical protein